MSFKITWRTHVICIVISLIMSLALDRLVDEIVDGILETNMLFYPTNSPGVNFMLLIVVVLIPITLVHEAIHGAVYKAFKRKVRFGFKGIYAYCQEVSGRPIERFKFLVVLIAPLTFISLTSLGFGGWMGRLVFLVNLLGSSGDIYMFYRITRCRRGCLIVDRPYGFDVLC